MNIREKAKAKSKKKTQNYCILSARPVITTYLHHNFKFSAIVVIVFSLLFYLRVSVLLMSISFSPYRTPRFLLTISYSFHVFRFSLFSFRPVQFVIVFVVFFLFEKQTFCFEQTDDYCIIIISVVLRIYSSPKITQHFKRNDCFFFTISRTRNRFIYRMEIFVFTVMAYMEMFGNYTQSTHGNSELTRHSVHAYNLSRETIESAKHEFGVLTHSQTMRSV